MLGLDLVLELVKITVNDSNTELKQQLIICLSIWNKLGYRGFTKMDHSNKNHVHDPIN